MTTPIREFFLARMEGLDYVKFVPFVFAIIHVTALKGFFCLFTLWRNIMREIKARMTVPLRLGSHLSSCMSAKGKLQIQVLVGLTAWIPQDVGYSCREIYLEKWEWYNKLFLKGGLLKKKKNHQRLLFQSESPLKSSVLASSCRQHLIFYVMIICFYCLFSCQKRLLQR